MKLPLPLKIGLIALGVMATALVVHLIFTALVPVVPPAPPEHDHDHVHGELHEGESAHPEKIDEIPDDLHVLELGAPTEGMPELAAGLAEAWVTFDSTAPTSDREHALAAYIPNAADWASAPPVVHRTPASAGASKWKTRSTVTHVHVPPVEQMMIDGVNRMIVEVSYQALHWAGPDIYQGSESSTQVWIFFLKPDGTLVDVVEPRIAYQ